MAAGSVVVLTALAPGASALPCVTTTGPDVCVIDLTNITDQHDGQAGSDTLRFNSAAPLAVTGKQFGTGTVSAGTNFVNFEFAEVTAGTTLTITSALNDAAPGGVTAWTILAGGTLNVSGPGGNAISDFASMLVDGTFNVIESETVGALSGSGLIVVSASEALSANGSSLANAAGDIIGTTYSGIISGAGGFTKTGGGMLKLTNANTFTGQLTVTGGTLEIGNTNAISTANGVIITSGELTAKGVASYNINGPVTITGGRLTGNAVITGNVTSNGGLQPGNTSVPTGFSTGNPGQDMGQISITGNYTASGSNAYVGMFVDLDAALPANGTAGTTHDFLDIGGNTSGSSILFAVDFDDAADVGVATVGNGIQLVRVAGSTAANAFVQGNALNAGAYQYLLRHVANYNGAGDDGFFLQSAMRDELVAQPALLSAGQAMIRHCFRDEQRVPDSPKGATYGRAWFGFHQGSTNFGPDTGIDMDLDYSCTTGGMDWRMGNGWFGGVAGGFGSANGDLVAPAGVGGLDGDARVIEVYAAFTSSAFFLNLSAGFADMDWIFTGSLLGPVEATSSGFIAGAQAGVALDLDFLAFKLMGALNYDDTNCGDNCLGMAATEESGLLEAKATARFDGVTWGGSFRPWASVSYSNVLSDGINRASAGPFTVIADTNDQLLIFDGGLQTYLDENFALFVDGSYHESLAKDVSGYKGGIGLKLYW